MIVKIMFIIGIILIGSLIFTALTYSQEIGKYCQENGFDYPENYDNSHACWKSEPERLVIKKIKCDLDWISIFTFQNPYRGCKFLKQVEEI